MPFSAAPSVVTHTGNGSSDTATIPWPYYDKSHVRVRQRSAADTALTTLVHVTDYTLSAAGDEDGGTLTFVSAPASGIKTFIDLDIPNTQETRHRDGDARLAATMNKDLDKLVQRIAMLEERLNRAFCLPISDTGSDMEGVIEKASLLGKLLRANATTGKIEGVSEDEVLPDDTTLPLSVANGGTAAGTAGGARTNLGLAIGTDIPGFASANVFTADQTIRSSDAGAAAGPSLTLDRASASPANSDALGALNYNGRDDGGNTIQWARHFAEIVNVSAAAKAARITWQTYVANALASRFHMGGGIFARDLTDPGDGFVNADGYQIGNVAGPHHYIQIEDQKADGTAGDAITIDAWTKATLNTEVADTGGHASLASSVIALAAGTYEFEAWMLSHHTGGSKRMRLRNTTDGADLQGGGPGLSFSQGSEATIVGQALVRLGGRFTIAATKNVELQYFAEVAGTALDDDRETAGVEVYAQIIFRKVA